MKRNKNKALFFAWLSMGLMVMSLIGMWTAKNNMEIVGAVSAFILCAMLGVVAILDYGYLCKKEEL